MKKVILFPGQGAQYKGMGKTLFTKYWQETQLASDILGYDLEELCIEDPNKQLAKTQFTQPALYVVNHFFYKDLKPSADFLAGHSLGEYNALLAAGAFDFETGLRLVQKRGALMGAASGGGMAAVIGIEADQLRSLLAEGGFDEVDIANYNTPTQLVLAGQQEGMTAVVDFIEQKKIRIVPLNVSAPFHSRYMRPAAVEFSRFLDQFTFGNLRIPVIANVTAAPYRNGEIKELLGKQIDHSVMWTDAIRYLMGQGMTMYEEMGRGVLKRMIDEIMQVCEPIVVEKEPIALAVSSTSSKSGRTTNGNLLHPEINNGNVRATMAGALEKTVTLKVAATPAERLGSASFRRDYGVRYSYVAGAMYRGTASKEMIIRMGKAGMLSFFGAAGLSLSQISRDIDAIQEALSKGEPYGMNLIHHLDAPEREMEVVCMYIDKNVKNIEASAFMQMTASLVYYFVTGLYKNSAGKIVRNHRIMAKVSRPEVAEAFLRPAPQKILRKLIEAGKITETQAALAAGIPISCDICVEADSGGHTDGGVAMVLFPAIQQLRTDIVTEYGYEEDIRIGLAGGIGTPQSAACAFVMGADFVLTGSINQCTVEAGTSDAVKDLLEAINVQDTTYAPAGDMFEIGAQVQVLRKGVLFPARANKLYQLYTQYASLNDLPAKIQEQLEKNYFQKPIAEVWRETKSHFEQKGKPDEITKAELSPKYKMALVFRWYFGYSSRVAFQGDVKHKINFQIHTGPSLGAFNQWVKDTPLARWRNRHVDEIGIKLMEETAQLLRVMLSRIVE